MNVIQLAQAGQRVSVVVNPADANAFPTLASAVTYLESILGATEPAKVLVAPGITLANETVTVQPGRSWVFESMSPGFNLRTPTTLDTIAFTTGGPGVNQEIAFVGLRIDTCTIETGSAWNTSFHQCLIIESEITVGTLGGGDTRCYVFESTWYDSTVTLNDNAYLYFQRTEFAGLLPPALVTMAGAGCLVHFSKDYFNVSGQAGGNTLVDVAGKANASIEFFGVSGYIYPWDGIVFVANDVGSTDIYASAVDLMIDDDGYETTTFYGGAATVYGAIRVRTVVEPLNPMQGAEWVDIGPDDSGYGDLSVYDAVQGAWGNHGIYKKKIILNVGGAAASHDLGWNVPAGAAILHYSWSNLKALTGAGGAVSVGLGIAGTSNKYGQTGSLLIGQKVYGIHGTWNNGSGDDIKLYAQTAPATPGGTVAGSGNKDLLALIYYLMPKKIS